MSSVTINYNLTPCTPTHSPTHCHGPLPTPSSSSVNYAKLQMPRQPFIQIILYFYYSSCLIKTKILYKAQDYSLLCSYTLKDFFTTHKGKLLCTFRAFCRRRAFLQVKKYIFRTSSNPLKKILFNPTKNSINNIYTQSNLKYTFVNNFRRHKFQNKKKIFHSAKGIEK